MSTARHTRHIDAPPSQVYRALLDPLLLPQWRVPTEMRCEVHAFEPREGGAFRVSLTYLAPGSVGKVAVCGGSDRRGTRESLTWDRDGSGRP